jgi:DNA-binding response OmpR family regulator
MSKILVIEDNIELLNTYCELLELEGHEVHTATNVTKAIHVAVEIIPDILIIDAHLINEPGAIVLEYTKNHVQLQYSRVLIVSGDIDLTSSDPRYLKADKFLTKPIAISILLETIRTLSETNMGVT